MMVNRDDKQCRVHYFSNSWQVSL